MSGGILGAGLPQGQGILGGFNQYAQDNAASLIGLGGGLMSGDWAAGAQGYAQGMQQDERTRLIKLKEAEDKQKKVQYQQFAQSIGHPELAGMPEVLNGLALDRYKKAPQSGDITEYEYAKRQGYTGSFADWQTKKGNSAAGGGYGLTPQWGVDAEGNPVMLQAGRDGTAVQTKLPEGVRLSKEPIKLDAGTHFVLLDPITRQQVGTIPKNVAGAAEQQKIGESNGTIIAGADGALRQAEQTVQNIEALKTHPGREAGTGFSGNLPTWASTNPAAKKDFNVRLSQLKGQTFLQAYSQLRGAGAITDIEGQKAEAAIARLDATQSEPEFIKALDELKTIVGEGAARLRARVGASGGQGVPQAGATAQQATQGIPSGNYTYVPGKGLVPAQ